jgi:acetate kinase
VPDTQLDRPRILTVNGGSSSLKFALFEQDPDRSPQRILTGEIDRIGLSDAMLRVTGLRAADDLSRPIAAPDQASAAAAVIEWIEERAGANALAAVGHRVVHGGHRYGEPGRVTPAMVEELRRLMPLDPEHLPQAIRLIEGFARWRPDLPQVACFDTAFHQTLPRVARLLPIPRRYEAQGVRRYGFHGLSYAFLMRELVRVAGGEAARGRIILAHLGSGASLAAVRDGKSVDTSMGFSPAGGLMMGTRPGDLDAGVAAYLMQSAGLTADQFNTLIHRQSGLVGVSGTSSDMRDLMAREATDVRAAEAIELFCYQTKKWIGAYAAALGGLDTLVFAGGIGQNVPAIRSRTCAGLEFLGLEMDEESNGRNASVISTPASRVTVRVMHTDEEVMIAEAACRVLGLAPEACAQ